MIEVIPGSELDQAMQARAKELFPITEGMSQELVQQQQLRIAIWVKVLTEHGNCWAGLMLTGQYLLGVMRPEWKGDLFP